MGTNRVRRPSSPQLDMNPMVDMAFLLVTFFLLASTFKVAEPAKVIIPRSVTTTELPDDQLITVTLTYDGRSFIGISDFAMRTKWLERYAALYGLEFNDFQKQVFSQLPGFGVPKEELGGLLELPASERNRTIQPGIPVDSLNNELADWLMLARTVMPRARVALKADRLTPYKHIEKAISTLTDNNILRFNMVTDSKKLDD